MRLKKEILKDNLEQQLIELKYVREIAQYFDVNEQKIRYWLKKYNLKPFKRPYTMSELAKQSRKNNGIKFIGENNPAKRLDIRNKISKSKKEYWNVLTPAQRSMRNKSFVTDEFISKCSQNKKEWWSLRTDAQMKEISERQSKAQANKSFISKSYYKSGWFYSIKGGDFYYRSSWELKIAEYLDYEPCVSSYFFETISYEFYDYERDIYRYFIPDFIVTMQTGIRVLLEVKPFALIEHNFVKLIGQWEWAFNNGLEYKILTEEYVFNKNKFGKFLEEVNNGKYKSDTLERCGFIRT